MAKRGRPPNGKAKPVEGGEPWGLTEFVFNEATGWTWRNDRAKGTIGSFDHVSADYERWRSQQADCPHDRA